MKKIILAILMILMLIMTGCGDTNNTTDTDSFSEDEAFEQEDVQEQSDEYQLSDLDGWWHLDKEYEDNYAGVQIFSVDSFYELAVSRDNYGNSGMEFDVRMELGQFVMNNPLFGDVYFNILDLNTIEIEESDEIFRKIEPIDSSNLVDLDGRWNFKGMSSEEAEKFIYFDGMNFKYGVMQYDGESIRNEGTYELSKGEINFFTGNPIEYLAIKTDADLSFRLSEDQLVLKGGFWNDDYFLREDAIGTSDGEAALLKAQLSAGTSWLSDNSIMFFVENGIFLFNSIEAATNQVWSGDEDGGTWELEGTTLILKWKDGTEDRTAVIDNSFEVESLQEIFKQ